MKKPKLEMYAVEIERPVDVSKARMEEYIKGAISIWCGSFKPPDYDVNNLEGDPLFNLNQDSVKVKFIGRLR